MPLLPLDRTLPRQIDELDSLRGIAALSVLLYHAFPKEFFFGWSGVDLFFVLSGFLITTIVLENRQGDTFLSGFYARRILRIWPLYFLVLAGCMAVNATSRQGYAWTPLSLLQHLTFTQNIQGNWGAASPPFPVSFAPSWSVAIEEQFYVFWPLVALLVGRAGVARTAAAMLVGFSAARLFLDARPDTFLGRGDAVAAGCALAGVLATAHHRGGVPRRLVLVLAAIGTAALLAVGAYVWRWWGDSALRWGWLAFPALALLWASVIGLVVLHAGSPWLAALRWAPLRETGKRSYGLYMYHYPVFLYGPTLLAQAGIASEAVARVLSWAVLVAIVLASYRWYEKPFLARKSRFGYGTPKPVDEGALAQATTL